MRIGEVAEAAGVGIDTIRYYERRGLLPVPTRTLSGYRDYGQPAVVRLQFIQRAKTLGFSLADIAELLALSADRERGVAGVKARAEAQLVTVEERITELERMQEGLRRLIAACPGHGELEACPILAALSGEKS